MSVSVPGLQAVQRRALAARLRPLCNEARIDLVIETCIDTGGTFVPANAKGDRNSHYAELSLLGIYHQGNDAAEAIANWIKAITRMETSDGRGVA